MSTILIIGAGHAGTQFAASLRKHGYKGKVKLASSEADLPYHKPPLSKAYLSSREELLQPLRSRSFFESQGIELMLGRKASKIVRDEKLVIFEDGQTVAYDQLVLATGTVPVSLACPGCDLDAVFCLRTADDARSIRRHLQSPANIVVVGGGFIGLESAAMLAKVGHNVTVLELSDTILTRVCSPEIAAEISSEIIDLGVDLRCGVSVDSIEGDSVSVQSVATSDGNISRAELVIIGIGAKPPMELAETAGLDVSNGIKVDSYMQSSHRDIFAIGDCANFPQVHIGQRARLESVQNAIDQADHLAQLITGKTKQPYSQLPWFWSDIGNIKLQIAGLTHCADKKLAVNRNGQLSAVYHYKGEELVCVETINSGGEHMLARQMISANYSPSPDLTNLSDLSRLKEAFLTWKTAKLA